MKKIGKLTLGIIVGLVCGVILCITEFGQVFYVSSEEKRLNPYFYSDEAYEVKEYDKGSLYKLAVDSVGYLGEERLNIYFYVTEEKIYRLWSYIYQDEKIIEFYDNDDLIVKYLDTDERLMDNGVVVCQKEPMGEQAEDGTSYNISVQGNQVIYTRCDKQENGERGFYESLIWEKNKGLVAYGSGYGVEGDILYLSQLEVLK